MMLFYNYFLNTSIFFKMAAINKYNLLIPYPDIIPTEKIDHFALSLTEMLLDLFRRRM